MIGLADVEDPDLRARLRTIGLVDVYTKPISSDELYLAVRRVLDRQRLTEATGLIGQSEEISAVLLKVEQIAPVSSTVIIEGESGTGKELVAQAIHRLSPRRGKPFIAVDAGALPVAVESDCRAREGASPRGERRIGRFERPTRNLSSTRSETRVTQVSCCACWRRESSRVSVERRKSQST